MSEVVNFPGKYKRPAQSGRADSAPADDRFMQALKAKRLPKDYPPKLAKNIGRWAEMLSPSDPADGAKRLFRAAFPAGSKGHDWEDKWRKRKRLVRLPNEDAPPFDKHGDYERPGENYLKLAQAFVRIYEGPGRFGKSDAAQMLLQGTALNPQGAVNRSEEERLHDCLARIESEALRGNAQEAFRLMSRHRLDVVDGRVQLAPNDTPTIWPGVLKERREEWLEYGDERPWWIAHVPIGNIYFPMRAPSVRVEGKMAPEIFANIKQLEAPSGSGYDRAKDDMLIAELDEILSIYKRYYGDINLRDVFLDDEGDSSVWLQKELTAFVCPTDDASGAELRFGFCEHRGFYGQTGMLRPIPQINVRTTDGDFDFIGHTDNDDEWSAIIDDSGVSFWPSVSTIWDQLSRNNWEVENNFEKLRPYSLSGVLKILMGFGPDAPVFEPSFIWDDPTQFAPAAVGSPAATLMRNAAYAPEGERLADKLRALIEPNAELVVSHYQEKARDFDLALSRAAES